MPKNIYFCSECDNTVTDDEKKEIQCPKCGKPMIEGGPAVLYNVLGTYEKRKACDQARTKFFAKKQKEQEEHEVLTKRQQIAEKANKIIVTTADLKQDYDVIMPVFMRIVNGINGDAFVKLANKNSGIRESLNSIVTNGADILDDLVEKNAVNLYTSFFYLALAELKEEALLLGADAIVGMRLNTPDPSNLEQIGSYKMEMYGTAVKFKK